MQVIEAQCSWFWRLTITSINDRILLKPIESRDTGSSGTHSTGDEVQGLAS